MYCKTVWHGLYILPYGDIRLCSIGATADRSLDMGTARDKDGNIMNILTHSIYDIMNSDKHCQVRALNMKDSNAWSPHCSCCENREIITNYDRSHRNMSRRIYLMRVDTDSLSNESNFKEKATPDGVVNWYPSVLDIRFGNLCNQKCIMCAPEFSNLWYDDWEAWSPQMNFNNGKPIALVKNNNSKWVQPKELQWYDDPRWWPKFEEMAPHLKHIYITGGEPMVVPAHDVMLDKLIDMGFADKILLEYDTNCSVINDNLASRWEKFKAVDIRGSMDAIKDKYELIRFGGKWEKFSKNILRLKDYEKDTNGKIKLSTVTTCFQISTAHNILESEEWCNSVGTNFHVRFLEGPPWHNVLHLPAEAREEILNIYKDSTSEKAVIISAFLRNNRNITWSNQQNVKTFIRFMDFLDGRRNTNWRSVFPELSDMLSRHIV